MDFFLFIGIVVVAYAAVVWAVMKLEKKKLEVFTVPWDEFVRLFDCKPFMPGFLLAIDEWVAELAKGEKATRDKVVESLNKEYPMLRAVESTNHRVEFTFCLTKKTKQAQPAELAELKAQQLKVIDKYQSMARRGEIDTLDVSAVIHKELKGTGIKVESVDEDFIFCFFGPSFGLKAYEEPDSLEGYGKLKPAIRRNITNVELANDGVQFTTVRV